MTRMAIGLIGLLVGLSSIADGAERPPRRTISVCGTVQTKTAPDQVVWNVSLTDMDKNLQVVKARSDEKVKAITGLRQKLGLGDTDLQTGLISVNREYERDQHGNRGAFKYFVVHRSITIRQRDLRRFDEFLDTLLGSADVEVYFNFESSRMTEIRAQTRLKALQAARDKARAMADALGAKLGPVVAIEEPQARGMWSNGASNAMVMESRPPADVASDTFVPGAMEVSVSVNVTFELVP
jgi:uncharacterized protein